MKPEVAMVLVQTDGDVIFQSYGLHDRPEIMEPIGTTVEDTKYQIGLGRGANRDR
jgi:hypothetical protein